MSSLIDELFYSSFNPWSDHGATAAEKNPIYDMNQCKKTLFETMTDEQKILFQKYEVAQRSLSQVREPQIFKTGFRFGMRFAFEGLHTEDDI
ncbi:MAG: hypothetical protein E7661_09555 [Ruminococcaceae bacterium]|nr:hypothetical protein [Oscillospiraceae bacterium]